MPAYDYRCTACDHCYEVTRPIGAPAETACPECGGPVKRIFAPVGVVFKGSGFHNTDYRSPKNASPSTQTAPDACGSAGSSPTCSGCSGSE
jgi:putative FmdB family regulatory protein